MTRRTRKDVRKFCKKSNLRNPDDDHGRVVFNGISKDRHNRLVNHGWIKTDNWLTKEGRAIIDRWNAIPNPDDVLDAEGAPKFKSNSVKKMENSNNDDKYKNLSILNYEHPNIPQGHDYYEERIIRNGKTDLELVGYALEKGNHIMLKGETGTGKSELAKHIAQETNRPAWQVNFSEETRISHILGHYEVYEENGANEMRWVNGALLDAIEQGGIFIADEINAADGAITMLLHSATEKEDATITVPERGDTVEVHDNFRMIGTMNPRYAGTRQQNRAFKNRFFEMEMDYLETSTETDVVMSKSDLHSTYKETVRSVVSLAGDLREDYERGNISTPVTPRDLIRIAEFMENGFMGPMEATKLVLLEKMGDDERNAVEKTIETCL